jgi:hypothetical protein
MCSLKLYTAKKLPQPSNPIQIYFRYHILAKAQVSILFIGTIGEKWRGKRGFPTDFCVAHLFLKLENAIHKRLTSWRAPRYINIHGHNPVTTPRHTITVMVITASIRTAPHRNNPSWVRHLIVDLSKRRCHLVRECTSNNHNVGLSRGGTEDYTKSILIVSWSGKMHHFDGAAGESEGHGPEGTLTGPVGYLIEGCSGLGCQLWIEKSLSHPIQDRNDSNYSYRLCN